jgi:3-deoxy-D-manno-octulosonic-acid transferase
MMQFLYDVLIFKMGIVYKIASIFNKKIKSREIALASGQAIPESKPGQKRVWFHASSMGEFEQAKPVIEELKKRGDYFVICSFYSPSGYETQKNYEFADAVLYMPWDSRKNAKEFIKILQPDISVFVRYDIWRNHIREAKLFGSELYLICATRPASNFLVNFPIIGSITRSTFNLFDKIFAIDKENFEFFRFFTRTKVIQSADTRLDRIAAKVREAANNPILPEEMFSGKKVLVAGSCWPEDETVIIDALNKVDLPNLIAIFVPHEPTENHLNRLESELREKGQENFIRLSKIETGQDYPGGHIIMDSIGKLLKFYKHAHCAMIGDGFGDGVHSTSEPAGYGIPLASGPKISGSPDAVKLHSAGTLEIVNNSEDLAGWLQKVFSDEDFNQKASKAGLDYVNSALGESSRIAGLIEVD